jgi:hypothetical protein
VLLVLFGPGAALAIVDHLRRRSATADSSCGDFARFKSAMFIFPCLDCPRVRDEFHGCMFSSCLCACFNRWRKSLMYSSSGSCCCWCISSNARKTSTRCFFSITRSACSNSRTTVRYRTVFKGLQVLYLVKCCPGGGGKVVWPCVRSRHRQLIFVPPIAYVF